MKHSRADYNRIQDPEGKIGTDEPVFLVRAQDRFAPHMVLDYAARLDESGLGAMAEGCRRHAGAMFEWQQQHGSKLPDLPEPPKADATKARSK